MKKEWLVVCGVLSVILPLSFGFGAMLKTVRADGVAIDETNFPDSQFRDKIRNFDKNSDGSLSDAEIAEVKKLNIWRSEITDLKGIEYFTELQTLYCYENNLKSIDVSKNTALTRIDCSSNQLTGLDVSKNTALQTLDCYKNSLESIDLSKNTALTRIDCSSNQLTGLDVSKNTALTYLDCSDNNLTGLNVCKNTSLTYLECDDNRLTSLDVSKNTKLVTLSCIKNLLKSLSLDSHKSLKSLYCGRNCLTTLDVSKNTELTNLFCAENNLTSLNVSGCAQMQELDCHSNKLTSLDLSKNTALRLLNCNNNRLASLNVSKNTELVRLKCTINQLKNLDLSKNTDLLNLDCMENQLTNLDVSKNTKLNQVCCSSNQLTRMNISGCTDLENLDCENNQLTSLDVSGCKKLVCLDYRENQLTSLDLSKNTELERFYGNSNRITELDISHCPNLVKAVIDGNHRVEVKCQNYVYKTNSAPYLYYVLYIDTQTELATSSPSLITDMTVERGKSFQYKVFGIPATSIKWSVGNTAVATVDSNGKVTGKSYGNTYLYAALPNGKTIKCLVRVVYPALKINYTEKTLHINQTFQFSVSNAYGQKITWSTGNTSVATVDANGKVTGKKAANTYLYAKSADGRVAKCLVKVIDPGTLGINFTEMPVRLGQTFTFAAKNAGILTPIWSTGNTAVAKVDSNGKVTPVKVGNTYLYVKTEDGRTAKCLIKVVDLSITYTEKTIKVGSTFQFTAKYTAGQKVSWRVGNTAVATVDSNGKVTGKRVGNTWLYASTPDGHEVKCLLKIVQ